MKTVRRWLLSDHYTTPIEQPGAPAPRLPEHVPPPPLINETDCTVTIQGHTATGYGAFVTNDVAVVYVNELAFPKVEITDWHGNVIGHGKVTGEWRQYNPRTSYAMRSVQFKITTNNTWYRGRYSQDGGNLLKGRRMRGKINEIAT
jgi:hypothetical protein